MTKTTEEKIVITYLRLQRARRWAWAMFVLAGAAITYLLLR